MGGLAESPFHGWVKIREMGAVGLFAKSRKGHDAVVVVEWTCVERESGVVVEWACMVEGGGVVIIEWTCMVAGAQLRPKRYGT